jgi:hypothetical protein
LVTTKNEKWLLKHNKTAAVQVPALLLTQRVMRHFAAVVLPGS